VAETSASRVIWMVDDDPAFRSFSADVALDAGIKVVNMSAKDLVERVGQPLPDGAMLDGTVLAGSQADDLLRGVPRIVICTAREYRHIAERWTAHPHVRVLLKPIDLDAFESAIQWLAGASDSRSWPSPMPNAKN
jgi:CheY-like chemotaxis protein